MQSSLSSHGAHQMALLCSSLLSENSSLLPFLLPYHSWSNFLFLCKTAHTYSVVLSVLLLSSPPLSMESSFSSRRRGHQMARLRVPKFPFLFTSSSVNTRSPTNCETLASHA
ncbi:uncharacterized protein AKAW2_70494A [Aspergillus luchuensis]|uniref:Uncharacterized protein n=1 Tax=Aspergillus kawachii TaxID=1069201 RepID=A0A7R7WIG9_ASPKA|nr:uncharacterized protein AKAW2_70494A [Aspergillus luchuensis]BCS03616.1 hypothetical protein AKAW2_70494A [Aspergillus luchuensis]